MIFTGLCHAVRAVCFVAGIVLFLLCIITLATAPYYYYRYNVNFMMDSTHVIASTLWSEALHTLLPPSLIAALAPQTTQELSLMASLLRTVTVFPPWLLTGVPALFFILYCHPRKGRLSQNIAQEGLSPIGEPQDTLGLVRRLQRAAKTPETYVMRQEDLKDLDLSIPYSERDNIIELTEVISIPPAATPSPVYPSPGEADRITDRTMDRTMDGTENGTKK